MEEERWKKVKELGSGTFGAVYLAYETGYSDCPMAVKSADCELSFAVESLEREAQVLHHLAGAPNIVNCIGDDTSLEDNKLTYNLLLEYAPGGSLHDLIKKSGPMPEIKVACYASMLLRGLDQIHSRGLVHCDLKPANVLVFPGPGEGLINELKIADFGLAKFVSEGVINKFPTWGRSGKRYYNRGTATHASPESIAWGYHGDCADIWSIGCIVYEMIMGRSLWKWDGNMEELCNQVLYGGVQLPRNLSQDGFDFLTRCLRRDMAFRWNAKQLMMHPFIVKNLKIMYESYGIDLTRNRQLSRQKWISKRDLFSERTMEPAASCARTRQSGSAVIIN